MADTERAPREVTLDYGVDGLEAHPDPLPVRIRDRIIFKPGAGVPKGAILMITFREPGLFTKRIHHTDEPSPVVVEKEPSGVTHYDCDLVIGGKVQKRPDKQRGGGIETQPPFDLPQ